MTVDVLFPFYGDVTLMKRAVRSVLSQSYQQFRLVVLDDAYPDDSVRAWFASLRDPRISYERNQTNLGVNGNFRNAVSRIVNPIVVMMGCDDIMLPNYLEWLVQRVDDYRDVSIFQPGVIVIDETGAEDGGLVDQLKRLYRPKGHGVRVLSGERLAISLLRGNWLYFPSLGWRAEVMTEVGFRQGFDVVQDLYLVLDAVAAGASLLLDDVPAFMYRRFSGSVSSSRALSGARFDEESRFFADVAEEMMSRKWRKAALTARLHVSSRMHAARLLPSALSGGNLVGAASMLKHVVA
jgi:glycosyltransferase involved in cell wall biosynthesis